MGILTKLNNKYTEGYLKALKSGAAELKEANSLASSEIQKIKESYNKVRVGTQFIDNKPHISAKLAAVGTELNYAIASKIDYYKTKKFGFLRAIFSPEIRNAKSLRDKIAKLVSL